MFNQKSRDFEKGFEKALELFKQCGMGEGIEQKIRQEYLRVKNKDRLKGVINIRYKYPKAGGAISYSACNETPAERVKLFIEMVNKLNKSGGGSWENWDSELFLALVDEKDILKGTEGLEVHTVDSSDFDESSRVIITFRNEHWIVEVGLRTWRDTSE